MSREYLVFGSNDDGKTLAPLGVFEASDHDSAKKKARDAGYESYGSCPAGNWSFGKITVKEIVDVEEMQLPIPGQLSADDVIEEIAKEKAEAREALSEGAPHEKRVTDEGE